MKIKDLIYKEQLFEYFGYNYENLDESEIKQVVKRLKTFNLLESEYREFKFFLRNFIELKDKITDIDLIESVIDYFIKNFDTIQAYIDSDTNIYYDQFDMNFNNILLGLIDIIVENNSKLSIKGIDSASLLFNKFDIPKYSKPILQLIRARLTDKEFNSQEYLNILKYVLNADLRSEIDNNANLVYLLKRFHLDIKSKPINHINDKDLIELFAILKSVYKNNQSKELKNKEYFETLKQTKNSLQNILTRKGIITSTIPEYKSINQKATNEAKNTNNSTDLDLFKLINEKYKI